MIHRRNKDSSTKTNFETTSDRRHRQIHDVFEIELFEVAKHRNNIAVLKTGFGKTMIVVMLIKEVGEVIKQSGDKRLILFLAPTVHQQFEVIKAQTGLQAEEYYGAKGVDVWDAKS